MRPFSKIFSDITKVIGASGVQFLITLFATPVMTRLYDPSAYATFGIINSAATSIIGIGMLSLRNAYPLEKESAVRTEILKTMLLLLLGLIVLTIVAVVGIMVVDRRHAGVNIPGAALAMLPLLVLTMGVRQMMTAVAVERAHFGSLALRQIVEPVCSRGGAIALGALLGGNPVFILLSAAVGHLAAILATLKKVRLPKQWRTHLSQPFSPMTILRRRKDFVFYNTASHQIQPLTMLVIQTAAAAFFSGEAAGHYILAVSIITMPVSLVALATAPVVYRHFIEIDRTHPSTLARHFMIAAALYLAGAILVLAPILFFGEPIFKFVFGARWEQAGTIASTMSVAYMAMFVVIGVQSVFLVTQRLKLQFSLEFYTCILIACAAIFCFKTMDFDTAIRYLAFLWAGRNGLLLGACMMVAFGRVKKDE